MDRVGDIYDIKSLYYFVAIAFVEREGRHNRVASGVRYLQHIEIPLHAAIFSRRTVHGDEHAAEINFIAINSEGEIILIYVNFFAVVFMIPLIFGNDDLIDIVELLV